MTDQELVQLMNEIIRVAKPINDNKIVLTSLDTLIKDSGLDSLDCIMINIYLGEIFGVPSETVNQIQLGPESKIRDMFDFMIKHKTKEPLTVSEAMENVK